MALKMRSTGGSIDSPASGSYLGRIVSIIDLDLQPGFEYQGEQIEPQYKVQFTYELPKSRTKDDKPHHVSEEFKVSDHERSKMYARVTTIDPDGSLTNRGENIAGLINAPVMVSVGLNPKGYAKVTNVASDPGIAEIPELENTPSVFDWDNPDMEVYNRLPEFFQNKLKASLNFEGSPLHRELTLGGSNEDVPF